MRYRIYSNGECFKVKRKNFIRWYCLDTCNAWGSFPWDYGIGNPKKFDSLDEVLDFLDGQLEILINLK